MIHDPFLPHGKALAARLTEDSDFKEENWSESVKVLAASLRSIADTYFTSSIWVPDDEDMKVVKGIR